MASPLSIGIELQPPGVDQRWVRIWVLTLVLIVQPRPYASPDDC